MHNGVASERGGVAVRGPPLLGDSCVLSIPVRGDYFTMLRYQADLKTLLWIAATTVVFVVQWRLGWVHWWVYGTYLYLSVSVAVIAHNHNHVRLWHSTCLNFLTDVWLTLFYGFPVFAWVPTHNQNHHKYHNTAPDYTKTWRVWEGNHMVALLTYPMISGYHQQQAISRYLVAVHTYNRP